MQEIFPLASGIVLALLTQRLVAPPWRVPILVALSLVFGFLASLASGELAVNWGFVSVDTALVLLAALATLAPPIARKRRPAVATVSQE